MVEMFLSCNCSFVNCLYYHLVLEGVGVQLRGVRLMYVQFLYLGGLGPVWAVLRAYFCLCLGMTSNVEHLWDW